MDTVVPAIPSISICAGGGEVTLKLSKATKLPFQSCQLSYFLLLIPTFLISNLVTCDSMGKGTGLPLGTGRVGAHELSKIHILLEEGGLRLAR